MNIFRNKLQLLVLERVLRLSKENSFLDSHVVGMNFLKDFLVQPFVGMTNPNYIDMFMLCEPYKEFTWLFVHLVGHDLIAYVPRDVLFIIHLFVLVEVVFYWARMISNETSHHILNFI
jgi:hypothetical protein